MIKDFTCMGEALKEPKKTCLLTRPNGSSKLSVSTVKVSKLNDFSLECSISKQSKYYVYNVNVYVIYDGETFFLKKFKSLCENKINKLVPDTFPKNSLSWLYFLLSKDLVTEESYGSSFSNTICDDLIDKLMNQYEDDYGVM